MKDREINHIIEQESIRQKDGLELIPSENYVSEDILNAMGSIFTNKYSEGYPRKRYYGGQEFTDALEELAIHRAQKLFDTDYHVNVQPYSGSPGNLEVYFALLKFGDKIMGMSLSEGGHLTHGNPNNFSGRAYNFIGYGVDKDERIDYDEIFRIAKAEKPKMIVSGATAYPRQIDFQKFSDIAKKVKAYHLADISHVAGLIAGHAHPTPFDPPAGGADIIMTTTHKTLRGPRGAVIFCKPELAEKIDKAVFPGMQGGPHMHQIAAKAVCFAEAATPEFTRYTTQIITNAQTLAGYLHQRDYDLVSGGTDNHLILMRLSKGAGVFAQLALELAGITLNKNTVPSDPGSPFYPSGIRFGTPAITTRGMKEKEMIAIGEFIHKVLQQIVDYSLPGDKVERQQYLLNFKDEIAKNPVIKSVRADVKALCHHFPVPGIKI